jgi:hypothetical protein
MPLLKRWKKCWQARKKRHSCRTMGAHMNRIKKGTKTAKITKDKQEYTIKYSWKEWCLIVLEIIVIVMVILWFGLSVKAVVQDIQLATFEYKVEGTVTVFEYDRKTEAYSSDGTNSSGHTYYKLHYIIAFDEETAGYSQYEYSADKIESTEKQIGERFVVLFNNINHPTLIQKDDIVIDNVILVSFVAAVGIILLFRKKIWK